MVVRFFRKKYQSLLTFLFLSWKWMLIVSNWLPWVRIVYNSCLQIKWVIVYMRLATIMGLLGKDITQRLVFILPEAGLLMTTLRSMNWNFQIHKSKKAAKKETITNYGWDRFLKLSQIRPCEVIFSALRINRQLMFSFIKLFDS